jgi:hypothetical protein
LRRHICLIGTRRTRIGQSVRVARHRWWQARTAAKVEPNANCPICGAPVVAAPNSHFSLFGGIVLRRTRQELIAACPVHGRSPYNDATLRYLEEEHRK